MSSRAAVVGQPISHSLSPLLHRTAYRGLGLDWHYDARELAAGQLGAFVRQLDDDWVGLSVTMPLKPEAVAVADAVDPLAAALGVANTLVRLPSGVLTAFNTDVGGIAAALREVAGEDWRPQRSLLLGNRATACSTMAALGELGCTHHSVVARRHGGPGSTALVAHALGVEHRPVLWRATDAIAAAVAAADVVVSTVPAGVADGLAPLLAAHRRPTALLLDVVYHPWPSALNAAWQAAGGTVVPGWLMLLHQAVAQVRLFTGREPEVAAMRQALRARLLGEPAAGRPVWEDAEHAVDDRR
ncbi:shikimate dehydrogenase [Buchananella hordeovulneris]|uniref:shikimate dehydrogenase n=1 Tax=Buchananella hordeovulneris TaxID=52770 RepID=UPI0026DC3347|nr:shikimate dehydrogenase [Buchananella hordeovulneris]MDO5079650.1 shikimate dehydrogenase [Buchananella hordeovulneris]